MPNIRQEEIIKAVVWSSSVAGTGGFGTSGKSVQGSWGGHYHSVPRIAATEELQGFLMAFS